MVRQVTAGDVGEFRGGSGFPTRFQGQKSGDLPFFKVSDMSNAGNQLFLRRANNYISESQRKALGAVCIPAGAIVFARVGAAVFLERKRILAQDSCIDNNMAAFIVDNTQIDIRFAHYLLSAFKMSPLVATSALPSLSNDQLRSIPLPVPGDLREQRRVVDVLGDTDDWTIGLERIMAKKAAIRQGMMQQLLVGRIRLPGFTGAWTSTTLGALGTFLKGRGIKRDDVRSTGTPCIRYGELYTAFDNYTCETRSCVSPDVAATAFPLKRGDLLFAGSGETREEIGKCVAYVGPIPAVAGGDIVVLRGNQIDPIYLACLVNTPEVVRLKARAGQGDAVVHIYSHALATIEVSLPSLSEQEAIARVITDADREIEVYGKRLSKARNVRQGMIQELLNHPRSSPVLAIAA